MTSPELLWYIPNQAQAGHRGDDVTAGHNRPGPSGSACASPPSWLVGSARDVARSLRRYRDLGVTHFVLSDTPYLHEIRRQGEQLLPLLREPV